MELATCEKYYDKILKKFPELSKKQVDKIIKHGLSSLYMLNLYGGDVLLKHPKYTMYFGKLFNNTLLFLKYSQIKWKIKLRIKYRKAKTQYSGYYYFGLNDTIFNNLKFVYNKKRRNIHFEKMIFYKILEECTSDRRLKHFFRVKYPEDCGFTMFKTNYTVKYAEYICKRNSNGEIEPVSYERNRDKCVKRRVK